jgi:hypothetical protein
MDINFSSQPDIPWSPEEHEVRIRKRLYRTLAALFYELFFLFGVFPPPFVVDSPFFGLGVAPSYNVSS